MVGRQSCAFPSIHMFMALTLQITVACRSSTTAEADVRCDANKQLGPSLRSARATHCTKGACEVNNAIECSESKTFSAAGQKNLSVPMIRDMLCKKTEASGPTVSGWW